MNPDPATAEDFSAGRSFVRGRGIVLMSAYLILLISVLFYSLVALWPKILPLSITSVKPDHGTANGGTEVDIVGTGFSEGLQVFFGDASAKSVTRKSDNLLVVTTPDSKSGSVTIEVDSPDGQKVDSTDGFVFDGGTAASSKSTPTTQTETLASSKLVNCRKSSFPLFAWACSLDDGVRLLLIVIVVGTLGGLIHVVRSFWWYVGNRNLKASWLLMYFLLPINGGGLALLFYLISRGISSSQPAAIESSVGGYAALSALVGMFSQQAIAKLKQIAESVFSPAEKGKDQAVSAVAPRVTKIEPAQGSTSGGTKVTISGMGLNSASRVTFDAVPAASMIVDSDTSVTAVAPAHSPGPVDIGVANSAGQESCLAKAFTYVDLAVNSITPSQGPQAGGTLITIQGNGFESGATVTIGGTLATSVSVVNATSITAVTPPAGNTGPADLIVTNPDAKSATVSAGFTFA